MQVETVPLPPPQFSFVVSAIQVQTLCRTELNQVSCARHVHFALQWQEFLLCGFHIYMNRNYAILKQRLSRRLPVLQSVTLLSLQQEILSPQLTAPFYVPKNTGVFVACYVVPGIGPEFITVILCEMAFRRRLGFRHRSAYVSGMGVSNARRLGLQHYHMIILFTPGYTQTSAFPVRPFQILCVSWRSVLVIGNHCLTRKCVRN